MARILIAWELGVALGHLARLRPVANGLARRGHDLCIATPEDSKAALVLGDVPRFSTPARVTSVTHPIRRPHTWADILHNEGFSDPDALAARIAAWRTLFAKTEPDLVVLDHSPGALLATRVGFGPRVPCVSIGTGFAHPPDLAPLPDFRPWEASYPDRLRLTEARVLAAINRQLEAAGAFPLPRLGAFSSLADACLLATLPDLDHYPERAGGEYVGPWSEVEGGPARWPEGEGPRVFAYLHPFAASAALLAHWHGKRVRVLAYLSSGVQPELARAAPTHVRYVAAPIGMTEAALSCHFAVSHAGHGTTSAMLLAGKPLLQIPFQVEQACLARRVADLGAGLTAAPDRPEALCASFDRLLADPRFAEGARAFAARHAGFDPDRAVAEVVRRIEGILGLGPIS